MRNIVKLILICQIKDEKIPQLIPLLWNYSILIRLIIVFILVELFYYKFNYNFIKIYYNSDIYKINYKW